LDVDAQEHYGEREEPSGLAKEAVHDARLGECGVHRVRGRDCVALVVALIVVRVIVICWGVGAAHSESIDVNDYRNNYHHHRLSPRLEEPRRIEFFELWTASDAQWYLSIAEFGYPSQDEFDVDHVTTRPKLIAQTDTQLKYAFFPLWPGVISVANLLFKNAEAAGFVMANVCSLAAMIFLYRLLLRRASASVAFWSVMLLASSPMSLFYYVPFTESLFLLLAVWVFTASEERRWLIAGITIGLASITRPTGIFLAIVPVTYYLADAVRERRWRWQDAKHLGWLAVGVVPLAAHMSFCAAKAGDPFYFSTASAWWGYDQLEPLQNLWHNTVESFRDFRNMPWHGTHRSQVDFMVLALSCVLVAVGLRILPAPYTAYAAVTIVVPLVTKDLMSFSRYAVTAWPLFYLPVVLIRQEFRRWVLAFVLLLFLIGQMMNMALFVNWHWVG
jgi:hypothetical protein